MTDQPHKTRHFTAAEPLRTGQWVRQLEDGRVESCAEDVALGFAMGDAREGESAKVHVMRRIG